MYIHTYTHTHQQITAAIIDLSPVTPDRKLSQDYCDEFDRRAGHLAKFSQPRDIPEFGTFIFSDRCAFVRPANPEEETQFVDLCLEVLSLHCDLAKGRVLAGGVNEDMAKQALKGQTFYCEKQVLIQGAFPLFFFMWMYTRISVCKKCVKGHSFVRESVKRRLVCCELQLELLRMLYISSFYSTTP
jgi:hypothetical protein